MKKMVSFVCPFCMEKREINVTESTTQYCPECKWPIYSPHDNGRNIRTNWWNSFEHHWESIKCPKCGNKADAPEISVPGMLWLCEDCKTFGVASTVLLNTCTEFMVVEVECENESCHNEFECWIDPKDWPYVHIFLSCPKCYYINTKKIDQEDIKMMVWVNDKPVPKESVANRQVPVKRGPQPWC